MARAVIMEETRERRGERTAEEEEEEEREEGDVKGERRRTEIVYAER